MSKTILLADDSVTIQKVIELTFMDEDYEVVSASNGEQALERLDEVTPDVVIADVHMPGASGFDVARRAKQLHPHVPVLLLVGTFEPFDDADYEASGADAYLKKPFDSQELLQRVNSLMEAAPPPGEAPAAAPEAPAGGEERRGLEVEEGFTVEEEPSWGADEPMLEPEPEPAAAPPTYDSAPTESLLPPIEEEPEEQPPFRAEAEPEPEIAPAAARSADEAAAPAAPAGAGAGTSSPEVGAAEEPAWSPSGEQEPRYEEPRDEEPRDEDLGTRAIAGFGGREEARPAPPAAAGGEAATGEEPFPELSSRAASHPSSGEGEDLFGLDEGDGSTEVQPPPDMLEPEGPTVGGRPEDSPFSVSTPPPDEEPRVVGEPPQVDSGSGSPAEEAATLAAPSYEAATAPPAARSPETPPSGVAGPAAGTPAAGLSDEDVDRIARRVAELVGQDVLREVAWEVVPDLAEVVIKDRLRELESQVEES